MNLEPEWPRSRYRRFFLAVFAKPHRLSIDPIKIMYATLHIIIPKIIRYTEYTIYNT